MDGNNFSLNIFLIIDNHNFLREKVDFLCSGISVFNVTDQDGNKVTDEVILDYIRKVSVSFGYFCELLCSFLLYKTTNYVHCLMLFMDLVSWS